MQLPIIVVENGDLDLFASQSDAEEHLETYDVAENRLKAYDAGGFSCNSACLDAE